MIFLPCSGWVWIPLIIAVLVCLVLGMTKGTANTGDKIRRDYFFDGPGISNAGVISTLLSILPLVLSEEIRNDIRSASLLSVASLLFAIATFLGFWLYSTVNAQSVDTDGKITLKRRFWVSLQGVIVGLLLVGSGCFCAFILFTRALSPESDRATQSNVIILECSDAGCRPRR